MEENKNNNVEPPTQQTNNGENDGDTFVIKNLKLTSIPRTGKVNVIEIRQEKRTDYLFTRLPKELALKYSPGRVRTKYAPTDGPLCVLATKYRGDIIDPKFPEKIGECYSLIFTPHFAETNTDLEHIAEGISDEDIKEQVFVLDESKALKYRNKWLIERELREASDEYKEIQEGEVRMMSTKQTATTLDDLALAENAVELEHDSFNRNNIEKWIKNNWIFLVAGAAFALVVATMF